MAKLRGKQSERGNSLVETAIMCPWIFLLMVGVLDLGFYAHAAINTQNAARAAALALASGQMLDSQVCEFVKLEMQHMPNSAQFGTCTALPLRVTAGAGAISGIPTRIATVQYETIPLLRIPGITDGKLQFARTAEVPQYE